MGEGVFAGTASKHTFVGRARLPGDRGMTVVRNRMGHLVPFDSLSPEEQTAFRERSSRQVRDIEARNAQITANDVEIARLSLSRRQVKPVALPRDERGQLLSPEAARARSRAGLDAPPPAPTWASTMPKPLSAMAVPEPRKRLDEMTPAERKAILEIM